MSTIVVILFLLFSTAAIALRFSKRQPAPQETFRQLPASQFEGLLAEQRAEEAKALAEAEAKLLEEATRKQLLKRAAEGDEKALDEAHEFGDARFYDEVMRAIFTQADGNPEILRSIIKRIVGSQNLRSSGEFAGSVAELWGKSPDQFSLAEMLHLAALAGDAAVFKRTISVAMTLWREGRIEKVSATDFLATVESAYWLVAGEVRNSGPGFLLKQAIAEVRRELAAANRWSA